MEHALKEELRPEVEAFMRTWTQLTEDRQSLTPEMIGMLSGGTESLNYA